MRRGGLLRASATQSGADNINEFVDIVEITTTNPRERVPSRYQQASQTSLSKEAGLARQANGHAEARLASELEYNEIALALISSRAGIAADHVSRRAGEQARSNQYPV